MTKIFKGLLAVLSLACIAMLLLWLRSPIEPVAWQPPSNPGLSGAFAANGKLSGAEFLLRGRGIGPEDVLFAPDGWVYTGYEDGRIERFRSAAPDASAELVVHTGGRPLGLAMDAAGNIIVADADKGLLAVSRDRQIAVLVDSFEGERMRFVDDLDIASDGTIWFSDASRRFGFRDNLFNFFEASFTGRLFSYSVSSGQTRLHMDQLFFANGVALGPDEEYVLVNETGMARIHRLWLKGEKRGQRDLFIDTLPGMPDNLSFNGSDKFWVALVNLRQPILDDMADKPLLRKLLAGLPPQWFVSDAHYGFVIALNARGEVVENFQLENGAVHTVTSANEHDGMLYLGSLAMDAVARLPIREPAQ
ncbi:MAG: SMP-30/gluconolactonase/LRE family protein [Pseudomonadales bacterium]